MALLLARYDLRFPSGSAAGRHALYEAMVAQAAYADTHGFDAVVLSEHHAATDGYLPSPLVAAAAVAAVTRRLAVSVAAVVVPLHDPLRLAEDIAVLDHLSGGRVSYVFALGYRPEEYAQFGVDWEHRGAVMEEAVAAVLAAWRGEPFTYQGRTVTVTPTPFTAPRPTVFYGGGSVAAARRAARLGLDFAPQVGDPDLVAAYRAACEAAGRPPGTVLAPGPGPAVVFCAVDPDGFWDRYGPHLLHDARAYANWHGPLRSQVVDRSGTVDELRRGDVYLVATPDDLIDRGRRGELDVITTHPLCGGLPPDAAWDSLRLLAERVGPALR